MWSYILQKAQQFERNFGVAPTVIYINPQHYEALCRENPALFAPDSDIQLGFRLVILPSSQLAHPEAALVMAPASGPAVDQDTNALTSTGGSGRRVA